MSDEEAATIIAEIARRTRHHRDVVRGVSVRGSIACRQVLEGFALLSEGMTFSKLEKAALITFPPRMTIRPGSNRTAEDIIRDIIKDLISGEGIFSSTEGPEPTGLKKKPSLDDFLASLQNMSLSKSLENQEAGTSSNMQIIPEMRSDKSGSGQDKMEKDNRYKNQKGWFPEIEQALKDMLGELEQKLMEGEISESDFRYQKKKLEDMLNAANYLDSSVSEQEIAETVMEMMEAGDRQWQKEMSFKDVYVYYHITQSQTNDPMALPKRNWYALKVIIDYLENANIVESNAEGTTFNLTDKAMTIVLDKMVSEQKGFGKQRTRVAANRRDAAERLQDTRHFAGGDVFRDISIRRTLREIARRKRRTGEINRRDIRIFLRENREPKTDIMLCLDSSGSMGFHGKLLMARLTAATIARNALKNGNRVGIVTFDDLGRSVVPPTDREDEVMKQITRVASGGNTNIGDGLKRASIMLKQERNRNRKSILLITDGEPTAISEKVSAAFQQRDDRDVTGEYAVFETKLASRAGIETSVIHIAEENGPGRKLVEQIARAGHGEVKRITRPADLKKIVL